MNSDKLKFETFGEKRNRIDPLEAKNYTINSFTSYTQKSAKPVP